MQKYPCIPGHHHQETRVSRGAQNVCAVTKTGTVLKVSLTFWIEFGQILAMKMCFLTLNIMVMKPDEWEDSHEDVSAHK